MTLTELIERARELAPIDRVRLANEILDTVDASFDTDRGTDAEWMAEFRRRVDDIESGRVELVDGRETMRIATERIEGRRT